MVTIAPMKFGGGTSRLHLEAVNYGAAALHSPTSPSGSSAMSTSSTSSSSLRSSFRCKMHSGFSAVVVSEQEVPRSPRATVAQRPPHGKERDLSSTRAAKMGGTAGGSHFDPHQHQCRHGNVTNHAPIASTPVSSPLTSRRRQILPPEESPRRQLPFNPGMTRKTAVTPRASRKAVVTEVRTDQARVVHQITSSGNRSIGLPKFHLNEQPSGKCRAHHCKSSAAAGNSTRAVPCGEKSSRDNSQHRSTFNSQTISSMNKIVKSSMSSSNTSRDTSIESIVPKYKTIGMSLSSSASSSPKNTSAGHHDEPPKLNGVSSPQKRSYNPQLLVRTNKFVLNDEKVAARKTNVVIPRIRTSLNERHGGGGSSGGCGSTTHNIPIYRDLEEKVTMPTTSRVTAATNRLYNAFKVAKENRPVNESGGIWSRTTDQNVPELRSHQQLLSTFYDDCDRDFFHREPSDESLYIDFSRKRSPLTTKAHAALSPLRPINKDVLLQRDMNSGLNTCTYQFEATTTTTTSAKAKLGAREAAGKSSLGSSARSQLGAGKVIPSVFYVSCASWMPKCNNKFSLRERRLREESKTISRKR